MDLLFIFILIFIAMTIFNAISNAQQKKEGGGRSRPGTDPARQPSSDTSGNDRQGGGGAFGDLRRQFEDMMNEDDRPTEQTPRAERQVYREENTTETSSAHAEYEQQRERLRRERENAKRRLENADAPVAAPSRQSRKNEALPFSALSGNDVVKGVIWSEVLGEPRARKPHRTNRMMKR
ncbi:hypothetical protein EPH95_00120 [Salicibibacter halophilus]|uniref:Uncharacterized protein n=1 Tax=Salicibibacter halophilus TaxID=2502791 RepID=A0A514LD49_9BACI|nr:hypothetical protein [Salicibibacter halophilus]QDI89773.1 hypothetical protein EPH95_00120 [Salicibibacter halophilus]